MRWFFLLCASVLLTVSVQGQPDTEVVAEDSADVARTQYIELDELEKDYNHLFGGDKGVLRFSLVELRNLTSGSTLKGVEVTIQKQERQKTGTSIALASIGSMWGGSVSATYQRIRESGYIFLSPDRLDEVVQFLDDVIGVTGRAHNNFKQWKVSLQEGFELGMQFDPDKRGDSEKKSRPGWTFIVTAGDATYTLSYSDGVDIVRELSKWRDRLTEKKN